MVAEAGFDGALPGSVRWKRFRRMPRYATAVRSARPGLHGQRLSVCTWRHGADCSISRTTCNACMVNVISGVMPIEPRGGGAGRAATGSVRLSERAMPILFETHRDGLLNDLYFTLQLMELVPEMRLCADLSHFVVDRELRAPVPERDQQLHTDPCSSAPTVSRDGSPIVSRCKSRSIFRSTSSGSRYSRRGGKKACA